MSSDQILRIPCSQPMYVGVLKEIINATDTKTASIAKAIQIALKEENFEKLRAIDQFRKIHTVDFYQDKKIPLLSAVAKKIYLCWAAFYNRKRPATEKIYVVFVENKNVADKSLSDAGKEELIPTKITEVGKNDA